MKFLLSLIFCLISFVANAVPLCNVIFPTSYYIIGDTNPTTQVMNIATGTMIGNTDAGYQAWLASDAPCQWATVTNAANNGSGAIRLTVQSSIGQQTGQFWTLYGSGVADGVWQVTVIDATHIDLIASAFTSSFTTGGLYGSNSASTLVLYWSILNYYNLNVQHSAFTSTTSATDITLTNPQPSILFVNMSTTGKKVILPAMNVPNAFPIGQQFVIAADATSNIFNVYKNDGTTLVLFQTNANDLTTFTVSDNTTTNGGVVAVSHSFASPLRVGIGGTGVINLPSAPLVAGVNTNAPTINAGFCATSPSIPASNGTLAFTINVGTACAGSVGTLNLPGATTGWQCSFNNVTNPASNVVSQTGGTTNTVTLTNYARTTGVASNFTASDIIRASCIGY